jgi:4'-phosphopantetheinyl transferase
VGVDVEERDRKLSRNLMALARRRFSPEEVDWLARFEDATEQQQRFMQLWTLKVMLTSLTLVIKGILCVVYMFI